MVEHSEAMTASIERPESRRPAGLRIGIAIATAGRATILKEAIAELARQTRPADRVCVCATNVADIAGLESTGVSTIVARDSRGSCIQRNLIIDTMTDMDVILFMDDDFFPAADYLESLDRLFSRDPDLVLVTGHVLADGVLGPGFTVPDARRILAEDLAQRATSAAADAVYNGYGCNMAVRARPLRDHRIRFDEALPLYGWLEDVDFSRRLAPFGKLIKSSETRGVHLGHKGGRQRGILLGYSQIANPFYLARKGTLSWSRALAQIFRNISANTVKSLKPEAYIDRRGRLIGHLRAFIHMSRGKLDPRRVLEL